MRRTKITVEQWGKMRLDVATDRALRAIFDALRATEAAGNSLDEPLAAELLGAAVNLAYAANIKLSRFSAIPSCVEDYAKTHGYW